MISAGERPMELETLSLVPPIFLMRNLASTAEADDIRQHAKSKGFRRSATGSDEAAALRSSDEMRIRVHESATLKDLSTRLQYALGLDSGLVREGDGWSVIRYQDTGGFYRTHQDWDIPLRARGHPRRHRLLTVQLYLSEPPASGGETWFPLAHTNMSLGDPKVPIRWPQRSSAAVLVEPKYEAHERGWVGLSCTDKLQTKYSDPLTFVQRVATLGLKVKPQQAGDALLFYHVDDDNFPSPFALHAGCATARGKEKWIGNMWVYTRMRSEGGQKEVTRKRKRKRRREL